MKKTRKKLRIKLLIKKYAFEVEVKAYKVAESIENCDSGEHVLVD